MKNRLAKLSHLTIHGRSQKSPRTTLPELLGKTDNDALRPAYVGEAIRVLILHFANEPGPVGEHVRNDSVDVIDGEHDAADAQRVHRCVYRSKPDGGGRVELVQLNALPVGS